MAARYGTETQFAATFSPSAQLRYCADPDRCLFGTAPELGLLNRAYNAASARNWVAIQLSDINEFCSCQRKMTTDQIRQCAALVATEFFYMKVTELMLFCWRFKGGRYGRFYGTVDPMVIMDALRRFATERATAYARHEAILRRREAQPASGAISYAEWLRIRDQWRRDHGESGE